MKKIDLYKIISLYEEIEINSFNIKKNLEILKEIYKELGIDLEENTTNSNKFFINKITKATKEILDNLPEDEKLRFRQYVPEVVLTCLLSDEERIKKVEKGQNEGSLSDYEEILIAESLNYTDEQKAELVKTLKDGIFMAEIVATIEDDDIKIQLLKEIKVGDLEKVYIIKSIKSDDKKIELLEFVSEIYGPVIIITIQNDDKKIQLLSRIDDERDKFHIVLSVKDDEKKIECLQFITKEKLRINIIISLKNDENKIAILDKVQSEKSRFDIIKTIKDDKLLVKAISYLDTEKHKAMIIYRLESDDKKIELLEDIVEEENRSLIIQSLESDDKKIELLDTIKDEDLRAQIVQSLEDDDKKLAQLVNFPYEEHRVDIIDSLESDDKKIIQLDNIEDEHNRFVIIRGIKDVDKKIEAMVYLESESNKLAVANSITDPKKKLKALTKINKNYEEVYDLIYGEKPEKVEGKYTSFGLPKNMTIGIEIESVGENHNLLPDYIRNWDGKAPDESLGNKGKEFRSPVMRDREEDVKEVYIVNEILKSFGMEITPKCGGHIHIGADYITTEDGYKQLLELWGNAEEIYYLISNKEGELPREGVGKFATPISFELEQGKLEKIPKDRFLLVARGFLKRNKRFKSLNLMNINSSKNTIEFRLANGTLDGDTWVENIRLFGRTVEIAEDLGQIVGKLERGEELTEEEKTKYALKEMLKDDALLDAKMDILMKILFTEEEQEVYYKRYRANKTLEEQEHRLEGVKFGKIDFKQVYDEIEKEKQKGRIEKIVADEESR